MGQKPQNDSKVISALRKEAQQSPAVMAMFEQIGNLPHGRLEFKVSMARNGDWMAESVNLPGILTGGRKGDDINELIEDATFTFFEIPRAYCSVIRLFNTGEKKAGFFSDKRIAYYQTEAKKTEA